MHLFPGMRGGNEVFAPLLDPAHRAPELDRGEGDQHVLDRLDALLPETAADVAGDHANAVRGHAQ